MAWLVNGKEKGLDSEFRRLLSSEQEIMKIPGVHDALTALLAKKTGFSVLYLSGAAFSAGMGLPDLGLITLPELAQRVREIVRASGLPLLVDIDTGYGSPLGVTRSVHEMAEAGAAGIQIEDQDLPKKCGHLNGKKLISTREMAQKIRAARRAGENLVIVARTDAKASEGLAGAIDRAKAYLDAGADVIFPEALSSEEEFRAFSEAVRSPLLANMTEFGKTPYYSASQFQNWGYKMVIFPVTSLRVAAKAVERVFALIRDAGTQQAMLDDMLTRQELYELIRYFDYEDLDNSNAKTVFES